MKEVKRVSAALRAVERWEEYLFCRALGMTFIVWAVTVAVAGFITLTAERVASVIGLSKEALVSFTWLVAVVIAVPLTLRFFVSAGLTVARELSPAAKRRYRRIGAVKTAAIFTAWAVIMLGGLRLLPGFLGFPASLVLCLGIANVLTYFIAEAKEGRYEKRKMTAVQLLVGIVLVVASFPISALGVDNMAYLSMLAAIVVSYGSGGVYALIAASRALIEERER